MPSDQPNYTFGRPRKFGSKEELAEAVAKYFNTTKREDWRVTGLALALDTNRESLCRWIDEKRDFHDIIKKAKAFIEDKYAENCEKNGRAGDIFILKNMGWKDKQEVDMNHSGSVDIGGVFGDITQK
jgi:hypothetical protein